MWSKIRCRNVSVERVLSVKTDVFTLLDRRTCPRKVLVFFICGNPGTVDFVTEFLTQLSAKLNIDTACSYDIFCPGHANHHVTAATEDFQHYETFGLEYQIDHKMAFVNSVLEKYQFDGSGESAAVHLVSHSIGGYMCLRMLEQDERLRQRTTHISLLMPFMLWDNIPYFHRLKLNAVVMSKITQKIVTAAVQLFRYAVFDSGLVPQSLLRYLMALAIDLKSCADYEHITDILCSELFSARLVANFLHLGGDEIRSIPRDQKRMLLMLNSIDQRNRDLALESGGTVNSYGKDHDDIQQPVAQTKLHMLYTDHDEWAPCADIITLRALFNMNITALSNDYAKPRLTYIPGLTHSFTLNDNSTEKVINDIIQSVTGNSDSVTLDGVDCVSPSLQPYETAAVATAMKSSYLPAVTVLICLLVNALV